MLTDAPSLTLEQIEAVEKQTLRWVTQALLDYSEEIFPEFRDSPDDADGVAEDVTQESLNRLSGFTLDKRRLYGTVDYRRARYAILPELIVKQALFVDSKAEKSASSGRLQINQSSIRVLFERPDRSVVDVPGALPPIFTLADQSAYLTTTVFAHYHYSHSPAGGSGSRAASVDSLAGTRRLKQIKVAALPNGALESLYVLSPTDTIWNVGPDSPLRGEAQRARLAFAKLKRKRNWRVQSIVFSPDGAPSFAWDD